MPTYVLEGGSSITLPARPVSVRLQSSRAGAVRLEAIGVDGPVRSITPAPGMLVVPHLPGPVTVRAVPVDDDRFESGSVLNLTVGYESRQDLDPDRGVLNGLDVSGLRHRDVVMLEPQGDRIGVTVLGPAAAEEPLSPGAELARDAAREVLGTDQLPSRSAVTAVVGIDVSASMRPLHADGTVAQVLDVLAGVHRVVGRPGRDSLRGCLVSRQARWLPPAPPERFTREVLQAAGELPLTTGFRAGAVLDAQRSGVTADGPVLHWLVTDGAPGDVAVLRGRTDVHLVCPVPQSAGAVAIGQGLPTTVVGLPDVADRPTTFGQDPTAVRQVVASLVAPFLPSPQQAGAR